MKINYDKQMMEILEDIKQAEKVPTLLLHSCCAPCSSAVIERLAPYFKITIIYYNPNIEPKEEYEKRKEEQKRFIQMLQPKNEISFMECDYDNDLFCQISRNLEKEKEGGKRCFKCYFLRLSYTALKAKENNFDYFGTTLSISPFKNAKKLNEIGLDLEKEYQVKYLVSDFKKQSGYQRSIELSKQYHLYRQNYCGCKFSKKEEI